MSHILDDIAETPDVVAGALQVNRAELEEAAALVAGSQLVRLLGIGSSRHAAGYGATCFGAVASLRATVADAPGAGVPPPPWRDGDVAVVLSQSGETPALIDAVRGAGVPVIAIVNRRDSRLASGADIVLACDAGPERVVAATKTVTGQLALVRALAGPIEMSLLAAALRAAIGVDVTAAVAGSVPDAVVGGGFAGGWLADEIAIKLAEVAGRVAASEPLVEHLHGPIAAQAVLLAFVDGDDANAAGIPSGGVRVGVDRAATVTVPATGDPSLDVLTKLVVGQRIVVEWAVRLGEDPDASRGLTKVTPTR